MGEFIIGIRGAEIAADGRSVYAAVAEGRERLEHLREGIQKELTKKKLVNGGFSRKLFVPRVALLKSRHQRDTTATIDPRSYSDVADLDFGVQRCRSFELLSMTGGDGGYYANLGRVIFGRGCDEELIVAEEEQSEAKLKEFFIPIRPEPNVFIALQVRVSFEMALNLVNDPKRYRKAWAVLVSAEIHLPIQPMALSVVHKLNH